MKSKPKRSRANRGGAEVWGIYPQPPGPISAEGSLAKGWALQFLEQSAAQMLGIAGSCVSP